MINLGRVCSLDLSVSRVTINIHRFAFYLLTFVMPSSQNVIDQSQITIRFNKALLALLYEI